MQEALEPLEANYTAADLPFKGTVALPSESGSGPVKMSLKQAAAQAWATELALLHASGMTAEAQAANRYTFNFSPSILLMKNDPPSHPVCMLQCHCLQLF